MAQPVRFLGRGPGPRHPRRATRLWGGGSPPRGGERASRACPSRSWPTRSPAGRSTNYGCTTAAGPSPAVTRTARRCSRPIRSVAESDVVAEYQRALASGDVDAIMAVFEPDGYAREPRGEITSTEAQMVSVPSTSGCFRTAAASRSSSARSSRTNRRARSSTTWRGGAPPSCRPKRGLPSTSGVRTASWPRPASTTTSTRPPPQPRNRHRPASRRRGMA